MNRKMFALKMCLANDIRGLYITEDPDLEGFRLGDHNGTWYTVYCAENGYSSYVVFPDIDEGIDIADEKPLCQQVSLFAAVSAIKSHHVGVDPALYAVAPAVNSVTDYHKRDRSMA